MLAAQSQHDIEPKQRILTAIGYAAAAGFCAVSVYANLRYGLSLGKDPVDKATYAVASVAADTLKVAAPLLALKLWGRGCRGLATLSVALWLGCISWSLSSAIGFALSSRGEAVADRTAVATTRHGWEAKVERAESQLATLGKHRPADVIKAELASVVVPTSIWRRSRQCQDLSWDEARVACMTVVSLRNELATAEAAERLEAQLLASQSQLAIAPVVSMLSDPQANALARLIGMDEATIRTAIAILLAGLIEVSSALGFTVVSMAARHNPAQSRQPSKAPTYNPQPNPPVSRGESLRRPLYLPETQRQSRSEAFKRWVQLRLTVNPAGSIPAREAYVDFCRWAREAGLEPCTETRFGLHLSAKVIELGGAKAKRRDRTYYVGVSLNVTNVVSLRAAA